MDTKTRSLYILSTRDPPQNKRHIQIESEGLEKDIRHKQRQKESRVAILTSDKIDFKTKPVKIDKENAGDLGLIPGLGRSPGEEKGYPLQYSGLENSTGCIVHGFSKSQTGLNDFHSLHIYICIYT